MRPLVRATWLRQPWLLPRHPRSAPHSLVPRRIATTSAQHAAPVDLPRLIVKNGAKDHNSLETFIEYATRTKLSPLKTYYIGTHYEYTAALSLMRLGFSLLRTGAKNDAGIDLIGHWVLAPLNEPLPVILQCKARRCTLGPSHVRELEGSFRGIPPDWRGKPVLGLLVTTLKATKGTMNAIARSPWPMGFVLVSSQGLVQQFVWNRAASDRGLQGVGVTVRHTPRALLAESKILEEGEDRSERKKRPSKFANAGTQKDIQLTWMGSPIFPERTTLDQHTLGLMRRIEAEAPIEFDESPERPRRGPGRPRKEVDTTVTPVKSMVGRKPTRHLAPAPRGGQIAVPRAPRLPVPRPTAPQPLAPKRGRGRPKGSKSKNTSADDVG
ncbi:hypothetical protein SVAN01_06030 [Stagonosporopsis vannaccii]|nr:hypothetical protein SVAN01_06030 [Stagonosporopsis vannaccii]